MKEKASTALWGFRSLGLQMHGVKRWNLNPQVQVRSLEKTRKTWIFQALGNYVRVRSHTQKRQKYLFYSPYTEKITCFRRWFFQWSAPCGAWKMKQGFALWSVPSAHGDVRVRFASCERKLHSNSRALHSNVVAASYLRSKCFIDKTMDLCYT